MIKKILIFLIVSLFCLNIVNSLPIYLKPLDNLGNLQPNTQFNYTINLTTDSSCTNVVFSNSSIVSIDSSGIGFIDLDISSIQTIPTYLCEYKNGEIRKVHTLSDQVLKNIYINKINATDWSNLTSYTNTIYYNFSNPYSFYNSTSLQNLSQLLDNLGSRGYTHLSNFTNNLGYTSNLNFTNGANYWNNTYSTFNKTYADSLYSSISEPLWTANSTIYPKNVSFNSTQFTTTNNITINQTWLQSLSTVTSANISGNGTAGYIPVWLNSTYLNSSVIYQSGNKLGIGTTSPEYRLDFQDTIGGQPFRVKANFSTTFALDGYKLIYNATGLNYNNLAGFTLISTSNCCSPSLHFENAYTPVHGAEIYLNSSASNTGNMVFNIVGYNVLKLRKGDNRQGNVILSSNGTDDNYNDASLFVRNRWSGAPAAVFAKFDPSTTADILTVTEHTTSTKLFTVSSNGTVGIGTATPRSNLSITGNQSIGTYVGGTVAPLGIQVDGAGTGLSISFNTSEYTRFVSGGTVKGFLGTGTVPLVFDNGQNPLSLQYSGSGNVGIGTTSPSYKLDIIGYTNSSGYYVNGTRGITASGTSCTITEIKGGIVTGATCI